MDTASILKALKQERDRINAAIAALSGGSAGNGRRRHVRTIRIGLPGSRRPRRRLSAAGRKRISDAAKARWAEAKKAGKNSL
jgi:hypothetical protein